jgi:hypothetical protein
MQNCLPAGRVGRNAKNVKSKYLIKNTLRALNDILHKTFRSGLND